MDLAALGNTILQDPDSNDRRLSEYWDERPLVLVFARHFG